MTTFKAGADVRLPKKTELVPLRTLTSGVSDCAAQKNIDADPDFGH
jgi:hypothetical protein